MSEETVHEHHFRKTPGGLRCIDCGYYVACPPGMPDYEGAAMGDW